MRSWNTLLVVLSGPPQRISNAAFGSDNILLKVMRQVSVIPLDLRLNERHLDTVAPVFVRHKNSQ
jgi:hypothetical protein